MAAGEGLDELQFRVGLLKQLLGVDVKSVLYGDCRSLTEAARTYTTSIRERNLMVDLWTLRDRISDGSLTYTWLPTERMHADFLTKSRWDLMCRMRKALTLASLDLEYDQHHLVRGRARIRAH